MTKGTHQKRATSRCSSHPTLHIPQCLFVTKPPTQITPAAIVDHRLGVGRFVSANAPLQCETRSAIENSLHPDYYIITHAYM